MSKRRGTGMFGLAMGAIVLMACGGGTTREEAVAELVAAGFTQETAECVLDDLGAQGFEPDDLTGSISAEVEVGLDRAVEACISATDLGNLIGGSEEVRDQFIEGIMEGGGIERAQAECIADQLESVSGGLSEVLISDDFGEQIEIAIDACI